MKKYFATKIIRFQHCDPGGIVFTPQYFNLFTEVVEDWFREDLEFSFKKMVIHEKSGIPAMKIIARFIKPSLLGEKIDFELYVKRLREKTVLVNVTGFYDFEKRCMADFLFGFATQSSFKLNEWPKSVFEKIKGYSKPSDEID